MVAVCLAGGNCESPLTAESQIPESGLHSAEVDILSSGPVTSVSQPESGLASDELAKIPRLRIISFLKFRGWPLPTAGDIGGDELLSLLLMGVLTGMFKVYRGVQLN